MNNFKLPDIYNVFTPNQVLQPRTRQQIKMCPPLECDTFQKSIQPSSVQPNWDNQRIQTLFDKTFDVVLAQNPIIRSLNYKKPELDFTPEKDENDTAIATYTPTTNEIQIKDQDFFNQDLYLLKYYNKENNLSDINIIPESDIECTETTNKEYKTEKIKLTEEEKELFISSLFAHELRHSVQDHIRLSTINCAGSIKEKIQDLQGAYLQFIQLNGELLQLTEDPEKKKELEQETERYKKTLEKFNYSLNYQPKQLFNEDIMLKFSLNPNDNRYLSIKNHFSDVDKGQTAYENQPCEIDAFNYQGEFIVTQAPKNSSNKLRNEVIKDMALIAFIQSNSEAIFSTPILQ